MSWLTLGDILARLQPPLADHEISDFQNLAIAIAHALKLAREMPTTLDARCRALIVTKLQEAEHWSLELLRAADRERDTL